MPDRGGWGPLTAWACRRQGRPDRQSGAFVTAKLLPEIHCYCFVAGTRCQKGAPPVQGGIVNNVANPNVIFNLAGIKDPDQFMNFIGNNAEKITKALFTKGGQQKAKNQGKNTPAQGPAPKGNFSFRGGPGPSVPGPFGN